MLANVEQSKAINTPHGLMLKAGAGSGKTFVIIEHTLVKIKEIIQEAETIEEEKRSQFIKSGLSKIVLMTFTKKAAGEIKIRLSKRVSSEFSEEKETLDLVLDCLPQLLVTTIHGFCFRLIQSGHIPNTPTELNITSDIEVKEVVEGFVESWIEEQCLNELKPILYKSKKNLVSTFCSILNTPNLRASWLTKDQPGIESETLKLHRQFFEILHLDHFFEADFNLSELESEKKGKWQEVIKEFEPIRLNFKFDRVSFENLQDFFLGAGKRITTPKSVETPWITTYLSEVKKIKEFFNKGTNKKIEDFIFFYSNIEQVETWEEEIRKCFVWVEGQYLNSGFLTFSDLEYFVYKGVRDEEVVNTISSNYEYLIVDEFQDTSLVQYEIIKKCVNGDFSKLFFVGDPKQSIYRFRGGELDVFFDAEKQSSHSHSLKSNYRSEAAVVEFCNEFFEKLFLTSPGFELINESSFPFERQLSFEERNQGEIRSLTMSLPDTESKYSSDEINELEAKLIVEDIEQRIAKGESDFCLLYRSMAPSLKVVKLLMSKNIGFNAQVKIPLLEDPILEFFRQFIFLSQNQDYPTFQFFTENLTVYMGRNNVDFAVVDEQQIYQMTKAYGPLTAFKWYLSKIGIFTSNYENNLNAISALCTLYGNNFEKIIDAFQNYSMKSYSMDYRWGDNSSHIQIMSVHASKGLEFNHVYLAGIFTNESKPVNSDLFGKNLYSFKYPESIYSKKKYRTPQFILESLVNEELDFGEVKRLFYVAATRAKISLTYSYKNEESKISTNKNSWIKALNLASDFSYIKTINVMDLDEPDDEEKAMKRPFLQSDNLGNVYSNKAKSFLVLPDLSVTRLAVLASCPRKFYLKNVLRFEDIDNEYSKNEILDFEERPISNAKRGSEVHADIENFIKTKDLDSLQKHKFSDYLKKELDSISPECELISEEPMKFSVHGQMIVGTPDLIVKGSEVLEIWDFKTGRQDESKEESYWMQLMLYAIGCDQLYSSYNQVVLKLLYLDGMTTKIKNFKIDEINQKIMFYWDKISSPLHKNTDHCGVCEYGNLCLDNSI